MTLAPTDGERLLSSPGLPGGIYIESRASDGTPRSARCSVCSEVTHAGRQPACDYLSLMASHLRQHEVGRARDITVDWTPEAACSVCDDDGDVTSDGQGGLVCGECGASWALNGTSGYRNDED